MKFNELLKNKEVLKALEESNFVEPTAIQEQIIPLILDGIDVLGQSRTGTGKTLAFAAPILEVIDDCKKVQSLILAPTRELAIQISREIEEYAKYTNIKTLCVYGSSSIEEQIKGLKKGAEIVIGTPGRVKDLINRRALKVSEIRFFVLDEADEMLSMGFREEIEFIFDLVNNDKQVLLFSATMPSTILSIAEKYMSPEYKMVSVVSTMKTAEHIDQSYYLINDNVRFEAMCRVIDYYNYDKVIIFCRTKKNADDVFQKMSERGYSVDVIHGDITQGQRIATLDRFKFGVFKYLIATDVAARGIHVDDVNLVVNYNFPESNEAYVHRIGRTGRVDKKGMAVTFIKKSEENILLSLERYIKAKIVPKELPNVQEILANRTSDVKKYLDELCVSSTNFSLFDEYLNSLGEEGIRNITKKLLEKQLLNNLGSNFNTDILLKDDKKKKMRVRNSDDSIRVFVTIGKMDRIEKRDFLKFIEKRSGVPEGTCTGVEIMTKFTFMNINKKYFDKVLVNCHNTKYNNRVIRIEKAKK